MSGCAEYESEYESEEGVDKEIPLLWIVPWISSRARPLGVCRRVGSGFVLFVGFVNDVGVFGVCEGG